jgi:hypothetical protein
MTDFELIAPKVIPPLDSEFRPAVLANQAFRQENEKGSVSLVLGLERSDGEMSRFEIRVHAENHPGVAANYQYVERLVKFLLWQRGGHTLYIGGPSNIGNYIQKTYATDGERSFDFRFMGEQVYERSLKIVACQPGEVPAASETGKKLGRNLAGCRIGFDLGASDRKVSAVVDGTPVYSEEVTWEPRKFTDPSYHYSEILKALRTAASKMSRVDAIGGSSAGIYIKNRPMVSSLFRGVPAEKYDQVKDLFIRLRDEMGVPLEVINDHR